MANGKRDSQKKPLIIAIGFTALLLVSVSLAIQGTNPGVAIWSLVSVGILVALFHIAFRASDFFSLVFANAVGVYTCLYMVFQASNFAEASAASVQIGYVLPLVSFGAGVLWRRKQIQHLMAEVQEHHPLSFSGLSLWVGPLILTAIATTLIHASRWSLTSPDANLVIAMTVIAVIGWAASRHIALFLLETGVVFSAFLVNAARLAQPAFALLTCYSLLIIFFGSLYTVFDQISLNPNFRMMGEHRPITFSEGLYLSVDTLTMIGFGDISGYTPMAHVLIAVEILCGVMLLLFGVEAMLERRK